MKDLFKKDNFIFSNLEGSAKKSSLIICGLVCLLFVIASFAFMNFMYCFTDAIGSIVSGSPDVAIHDVVRSVPIFVTFFEVLWLLLLVHSFYRNEEDRLAKKIKRNLITIMAFAIIVILYVIIGRIAGIYLKLTEGSPSALFPLDTVLFAILFLAIAIIGLFFKDKVAKILPLELTSRGKVVRKARIVYCIFVTLWLLFSLFAFSGFMYGVFIVDFKHDGTLYGIAILLSYFTTFASIAVWELFYNDLKEEQKKQQLLKLGLISLCISLITTIFYFVALGLNLDAPSNIGFGILPVAYAASVNIATMLLVAVPVIVSIVATVKGLIIRK